MGIIVLLIQVILWIGIALIVKKILKEKNTIHSYLYANRTVPEPILIISIFNTWIWSTSILGATEAGITYGLLGGVAYAMGASLGFIALIPIIVKIRKLQRNHIFITDFIKHRLSVTSETFFYIICIFMVSYTVIQQSVGIADVFSVLWGMSYKFVSFLIVICVAAFVIGTGMYGVFIIDFVNFFITIIGLGLMVILIVFGKDAAVFQAGFGVSLMELNSNLFETMIIPFFKGLTFYILASTLVGASQTILDPNYYVKAYLIKDEKKIGRIFRMGGVYLWAPVVILISTVLSCLWKAYMGQQKIQSFNTKLLIDVIFNNGLPESLGFLFTLAMTVIVITTMTNAFIGILALMTLRGHEKVTKEVSDDSAKLKFGKLFTFIFALFCGLIALSLESISLWKINIVCGIFFAAPCGIILFINRIHTKSEYLPILSVVVGIVAGLAVWAGLDETNHNLFLGTFVSFITPVILMDIFSLINQILKKD